MRFLMLMYPGAKAESGVMPDQKAISGMMKYNDELAKAGVLLALDGLHPSSKGARVLKSGGKRQVIDGPFSEAKELVGGYWLIEVKSKEEAVQWASRCPIEEGEMIELRQVFEMSDFGPEVAAAEETRAGEIEARMSENRRGATA
jgi:hypothetical protein